MCLNKHTHIVITNCFFYSETNLLAIFSHAHTHTRTRTCTRTRARTCTHTHAHSHAHVRTHVHAHAQRPASPSEEEEEEEEEEEVREWEEGEEGGGELVTVALVRSWECELSEVGLGVWAHRGGSGSVSSQRWVWECELSGVGLCHTPLSGGPQGARCCDLPQAKHNLQVFPVHTHMYAHMHMHTRTCHVYAHAIRYYPMAASA